MPIAFDTAGAAERLVAAGEKPSVAEIVTTTMAEIAAGCAARPRGALMTAGMRSFDTLQHAKRLTQAGAPRAIAEAHALVIWDLLLVPLRQEEQSQRAAP